MLIATNCGLKLVLMTLFPEGYGVTKWNHKECVTFTLYYELTNILKRMIV